MTTIINNHLKEELRGHMRAIIGSAIFLFGLLFLSLAIAYFCNTKEGLAGLMGALMGVTLATINLFAMGYAFFVIAIKHGNKLVLLAPMASFVAMCLLAFWLTKLALPYIFGFALGVTAPVLFASTLIKPSPLDRDAI